MDTKKIIVLILILSIMFSVISVGITLFAFDKGAKQESTVVSANKGQGNLNLYIESSGDFDENG